MSDRVWAEERDRLAEDKERDRRLAAVEALLERLVAEYDRDDSDSGSLSIVACKVVAEAKKLLEGGGG